MSYLSDISVDDLQNEMHRSRMAKAVAQTNRINELQQLVSKHAAGAASELSTLLFTDGKCPNRARHLPDRFSGTKCPYCFGGRVNES